MTGPLQKRNKGTAKGNNGVQQRNNPVYIRFRNEMSSSEVRKMRSSGRWGEDMGVVMDYGCNISPNMLKIHLAYDDLQAFNDIKDVNLELTAFTSNELVEDRHWSQVRRGPDPVTYVASRMPVVYSACHRVLSEVPTRLPGFSPTRVLDFGAGTGSVANLIHPICSVIHLGIAISKFNFEHSSMIYRRGFGTLRLLRSEIVLSVIGLNDFIYVYIVFDLSSMWLWILIFVNSCVIVDKVLLETPEEGIDFQSLSIREIILPAECRERMSSKEGKISEPPSTNQSFGNPFTNYNFEFEQGGGSSNDPANPVVQESSNYPNYQSYMNKTPRSRWSKQDTKLFYEAVRQFGTDISMIQQLFPGCTHNQVKLKYKKEERQQPLRLQEALTNRAEDHSHYQLVVERLQQLAAEEKTKLQWR
ncbi:hypothetical protein ACSBR1_038723 [Camellia fascicularis]